MDFQLKSILIGAISAILIDVNAFIASRKENPEAKFDFLLALFRVIQGAIVGAIGGNMPA